MALDKLNSRKYRNHKERVFARDGRQCRYCGNDENLQIDHIISRKNGGTHDMDNLQVLCLFLSNSHTANIVKNEPVVKLSHTIITSPIVMP